MNFISDYLGEIIVVVLSAVLALATERWFPTTDIPQKRFWAAMLFILSITLGLSINGAFKMNRKMEQMTQEFGRDVAVHESGAKVHMIAHEYEQIISNASGTLRSWGEDSLKSLDDDLKAGYIPISREQAPTTIAGVYKDSKVNMIASNVGSIDFYFDVPAYAQQNLLARDHHVPIIRFFVYSNSGHRGVKLTRSCMNKGMKPDNIEDFTRCVSELNNELGSLCSVVVDFDKQFSRIGEPRDLLLMDNSFVAETELYSEDWKPRRAKATEARVNHDEVEKVRKFFHRLRGITGNTCTGRMDDKDVLTYFPQLRSVQRRQNQHIADAAFDQMLDQITGPD
jgi:hypothetical protein